jgi:hypothetical protein
VVPGKLSTIGCRCRRAGNSPAWFNQKLRECRAKRPCSCLRIALGWAGDHIMKSTSPPWTGVALALLALAAIAYVATPPLGSTGAMFAASSNRH